MSIIIKYSHLVIRSDHGDFLLENTIKPYSKFSMKITEPSLSWFFTQSNWNSSS